MDEEITVIKGRCEDCAFFNDCPAEYQCPALETLFRVVEWMDKVLGDEE